MKLEPLDKGFTEMSLHFGFAEAPAVPAALEAHRAEFPIDIAETSFFNSGQLRRLNLPLRPPGCSFLGDRLRPDWRH